MGFGWTKRLLRRSSDVSLAKHALPGCVERDAWRGRGREPPTLASQHTGDNFVPLHLIIPLHVKPDPIASCTLDSVERFDP